LNAAEVVQATFVYGLGLDEPLTMQRSSQTSWYLRDPIGTVTALTDALGAVAESYRYDAFGELAMFDASGSPIAASALQNPFLFAGRELDGETGVYHYRARAYSPVLGRFLQRDPFGQLPDVNVYRYVGNHPLDMIDPYGLFEERTHWTEWIPFDDYIFSPGVANFSAGMGDGISRRMLFGYNLTGNIRNAIGAKGVVNECSGAYFAGDLAAEAWERITFRGRGKGGPDVSLGARSRRAAPRGPGGPHTPDQRALKDLAEDVTNKGTKPLSREDAETVLDWAREVGYPGVRASAGDLASPSNWTANPVPHIHLPGTGRHGHVPVLPGVRPR
jgi:RHS repeat-associated protein